MLKSTLLSNAIKYALGLEIDSIGHVRGYRDVVREYAWNPYNPKVRDGLTPLQRPRSAQDTCMDISDLFKVMKKRRELKRDMLVTGTTDRHLDHMLKCAVNRDSIVTGAYAPRPAGFFGGLPTIPIQPVGLPFFTDAKEADDFYYPEHMRGISANAFVTRILPDDAVPVDELYFKADPSITRLNENVQKWLREGRDSIGSSEQLHHITRDTH